MKKIILSIMLLLFCFFAEAQDVIKLRSDVVTVALFDESIGEYSKYEEPVKTNILIVLEETKVTIYSQEVQKISILKTSEKLYTKKYEPYFLLECVDGNGIRCNVILSVTSLNTIDAVLLQYSDIMFVYDCKVE